jgi:hypothetical protein
LFKSPGLSIILGFFALDDVAADGAVLGDSGFSLVVSASVQETVHKAIGTIINRTLVLSSMQGFIDYGCRVLRI